MDTGATIAGIVMGAIFAGAGKIFFDYYQRIQNRNGIASAIAGEISGIIYGAETSQHAQRFAAMAALLRSAAPPTPPWAFFDMTHKPTPVLDAYIDRIGDLGGELPARAAHFYTLLGGIRLKTKILASGYYHTNPLAAAAEIDAGLAIWAIASAEGKLLVKDLQALSG
ncbi:MAG: hypothetical protein BGN85_06150 [Alphaproteobacteria bacterium 64-11]|nr:hypothetical protein [Alphaproteobacteria bacterium]OJU08897.1 MAG: hypothetical protein BGN85_06150 [Alphaproteobacteria bacterium 64-11]